MSERRDAGADAHALTRRWPERLLFAVLTGACLIPVWLFRYLPTQDGPAHVANAVILRDYNTPGTRHHEFFELGLEPFPNWTGHLLLAGLSCLFHPLIAEKLFASIYIVGFAYACRFFLASVRPSAVALAPLCLLFVYNRCFFMGFYSYCMSLPLTFLILGVCIRLPERLSPGPLVLLAALFTLAYFTHLVGYAQAVLGAAVIGMVRPGWRGHRLVCVIAAVLPSLAFCADYLLSTGLTPAVVGNAVSRNLGGNHGAGVFATLWEDASHWNRDTLIESEGWSLPVGLGFIVLYGAYACAGLFAWMRARVETESVSGWWAILAVVAVMSVLYVAAPDWLGQHGGVLKPRLAVVLPVLASALPRQPTVAWLRHFLWFGACALVAAQVTCIGTHIAAANRLLEQYLAGLDAIGRGHVVYVVQSIDQRPHQVSYLLHASHYYCLDTDCTNLDNYEAVALYFPVRFRHGIPRGRGSRRDFAFHPSNSAVDRIIAWEWPARPNAPAPDGFQAIFRNGPLTIYGRRTTTARGRG
jgi:hypothetical protein